MYTIGASPRGESTGKLKKKKKKHHHTLNRGAQNMSFTSLFANVLVFYIILWKGQALFSLERVILSCITSFCLVDIVILNSLLCLFM